MIEEEWKKNGNGLWVPPSTDQSCVDRAEFKVKVQGFKPQGASK